MDEDVIREQLIMTMRRKDMLLDQAVSFIAKGFGLDRDSFEPVLERMRSEAKENRILDSPGPGPRGVYVHEAKVLDWYHGPQLDDVYWPNLKDRLMKGPLRDVVNEIDLASTKVVAHLACPRAPGLKKRGLVLGYVQSGKTANYTAVMAKAADENYKFFIVLSGLHNNLRRQTQIRVSTDLGATKWHNWTTPEADFGGATGGSAILTGSVPSLAVVKKNKTRLESLRDWLRAIPADIRERTPILLLDDEADQATPSTVEQLEEKRGINRLVREIWREVKSGTYVGYTATPFANVFMDPDDDDELYPADFIIDLPRPDAYFGAERLFGREPIDENDVPDPGLDMVRHITDMEGGNLRPPSKKEERIAFDPELPASLVDAVTWFIVATAIRHARGQSDRHSSMLVHTTHYVDPHFAMKERIDDLLGEMQAESDAGDPSRFQNSYNCEAEKVHGEATLDLPPWSDIEGHIATVLSDCRVVVDNGRSEDRLDYDREDENGPITETVIAVGGGTLSRGLTLEGLVVSYFTRTSNTYDTLLQMGRWFGYRPGYEDLPRIWMQGGLAEDFAFLALVEEEMRQDIRDLERMKVTPSQMGVRIRAHPGRLAIVSRNKLGAARQVRVTYSGQRQQTFMFDEANTVLGADGRPMLDHNLELIQQFLREEQKNHPVERLSGQTRWLLRGIPGTRMIELLSAYRFHPDQTNIQQDVMLGWLEQSAIDHPWNVVVIGSGRISRTKDGKPVTHNPVDVGLDSLIPPVNRAPLSEPSASSGTANIKALMSHNDWWADLDPDAVRGLREDDDIGPKEIRRALAEGSGMLAIYPVSRTSIPLGVAEGIGSRRPMEAKQDIIGLGMVFPDVDRDGFVTEGNYYSVHPDWESPVPEEEDELEDLEGDAGEPEVQQDVDR